MSAEQLKPGAIVGRDFRVEKRIAAGGMGTVYEVSQLSTGKRRALKVMHAQYEGDDRARQRFIQEARAGASIDSDHIVEMVTAGIDDATGSPYIAMELLQGKDLKTVQAERGALSREEVREVCKQLLHGISAAHRMGLVHRDLKPENIFLAVPRREGVPFTVKVLDFGIAKLVQEGATSATHTQAIGSPRWMAPEQAERGGKITPATDVWSVGLIVFSLLTGKNYWRTANSPAPSVMQQMCEVLMEPILPPTERAAELGVSGRLPPGFDAWFIKCVARDPFDRFQDGAETLAALLPLMGPGAASMAPPPMVTPAPAVMRAEPSTGPTSQTGPTGTTGPRDRLGSSHPGMPKPTREVRLDAVIPRDETPGSLDASLPSGALPSRSPTQPLGTSNKALFGIAGVALAGLLGVFVYTRSTSAPAVVPNVAANLSFADAGPAVAAVDAGPAVLVVAADAGPSVPESAPPLEPDPALAAVGAGQEPAAPTTPTVPSAPVAPHAAAAPGAAPGGHSRTSAANNDTAVGNSVLPPSLANAVARLSDAGAARPTVTRPGAPQPPTTAPPTPQAEPGGEPFHARVMSLMRARQSDFIRCYEQGTATTPEVAGRLSLSFSVSTEGRAENVRARGLDAAPAVGSCAVDVVRAITFPPGGPQAGELVHMINFRREVAAPTPPPSPEAPPSN
ncbi:MAG: protein kinase [Myxococcales bacterium]|nr:protein kinase [Myxococcales bacterium]